MRNIPILDDAYMARRRQAQWVKAMAESYGARPPKPKTDPQDVVRQDYLSGAISVEVFEARLDAIFGLSR